MTVLEILLGIILIACALALVVVVLLQDSKDRNTASVVTGAAGQIFGKSKGQQNSKKLNTITAIIAVVLVLVVLVFYLQQYAPKATPSTDAGTTETTGDATGTTDTTGTTEAGGTEEVPADTGAAE